MDRPTTTDILQADLPDWRPVAGALRTRFRTQGFTRGMELLQAITPLAEETNHHPDVTLTWPHVDISLVTHDAGNAITQADVDLARRISEVAREQGIAADPSLVQVLTIGLDTADAAAIEPFWSAVLTGSADHVDEHEVHDPTGQLPEVWFQATDAHETPRMRFHLDVYVPHDEAAARVKAAVAAGGRVVETSFEPSWTVVQDAQGNTACVCTDLPHG